MTHSTQIKVAENLNLSRTVAGFMHLASSDHLKSSNELISFVENCFEIGVTTFDHADIYGSYTCEEIFGNVLKEKPSLRTQMQLITKCGIKLLSENRPDHKVKSYDTSKSHILASVDRSLKNLNTDFIDLLLIHRPDPLMNSDEIAEAFEELKSSGKVLHFGVSNFTPFQFELLQSRLDEPLITNQIEFSVSEPKALLDGSLDQCQQLKINSMAWSPMGGGTLFTSDSPKAKQLRNELNQVKEEVGAKGIDQVALAWILKHPSNVIPVMGSLKFERIIDAVAAEAIELSLDQWFRIYEASMGNPVP